jgi:hypothetical protein
MSCLGWILCSSRMFLKITLYRSLLKSWTFNEIKWVLLSSSSLSSEELRLLFELFCCVRKMYDVLEPDFSMLYITLIWTVVSICRKYSCRVNVLFIFIPSQVNFWFQCRFCRIFCICMVKTGWTITQEPDMYWQLAVIKLFKELLCYVILAINCDRNRTVNGIMLSVLNC